MRRWIGVGLLVCLAAVSGCGGPTQPDPSTAATLVVAESRSSAAPAGATSPPTIAVEERTLVVLGLIRTPAPCYTTILDVSVNGGHVAVQLTAQAVGQICVGIIGEFAYRVTKPLPPGTYQVTVTHRYPGTGWATELASQGTITVF